MFGSRKLDVNFLHGGAFTSLNNLNGRKSFGFVVFTEESNAHIIFAAMMWKERITEEG